MRNLIIVLFLSVFVYGESTFSNPQPSFDNPRKVVFKINDSNLEKVNHNLGTMYNILKEYPEESLNIAVVVYGNGMRALRKDYDKNTLDRINSLMEYDVEFYACRNTMESMKWTEDEFIDDLVYVQAELLNLLKNKLMVLLVLLPINKI